MIFVYQGWFCMKSRSNVRCGARSKQHLNQVSYQAKHETVLRKQKQPKLDGYKYLILAK